MERPMSNIHDVVRHLIKRAQSAKPGTSTIVRFRDEEVTITFHGLGRLSMPKEQQQNTLLGIAMVEILNDLMEPSGAPTLHTKRLEH